jgi:hypothetical protein
MHSATVVHMRWPTMDDPPHAAHADPQPSLGATSMSANGMPADPRSALSAPAKRQWIVSRQ